MTTKLLARRPKIEKQGHAKALIFGASGVGKTWIALDFPTPYYIDTEGGADLKHYQEKLIASGGQYMGPEDGALDFDTVIGQVKALSIVKHDFKTLIIDSITKLFQSEIANKEEELEEAGKESGWGASKKPAVSRMRRLVNALDRLDMNVILISHEATEYGLVNGVRNEIGKRADVWEKLPYELDLVFQARKQGKSRIALVTKSRLTGFPEGESFPLDYPTFSERYGKDLIEAAVVPVKLATDEEVAEVKRLLEIVKTDEEEIAKWFKKAKVETWEDMKQEEITKVIEFLTKKKSS